MQNQTAGRHCLSAAFALLLLAPAALPAQTVTMAPAFADPAATDNAADITSSPEVAAAERLFSAWLEAQIAYRGLPGVAVGVVYDQ